MPLCFLAVLPVLAIHLYFQHLVIFIQTDLVKNKGLQLTRTPTPPSRGKFWETVISPESHFFKPPCSSHIQFGGKKPHAVRLLSFFDPESSLLISVLVSAGTRKSFDHLISDTKAPKRQEMESGITTPPKMRRVAENDYEMGEEGSTFVGLVHSSVPYN